MDIRKFPFFDETGYWFLFGLIYLMYPSEREEIIFMDLLDGT